jgi:WD40 repeat protein
LVIYNVFFLNLIILLLGDTRGILHAWNLSDTKEPPSEIQFPISSDCCNGVSFSPYLPVLATTTGQFHFEIENEINCEIDNSLSLWWFGRNKVFEE